MTHLSRLSPTSPFSSGVLNDLDLSLTATKGGVTLYPNGLSKPDDKNNVERIRLEKPQRGSRYTVQVKGTQLIEPQTYSLAITGCLASPDSNPVPTAMPKLPASPTPVPTTSPEKLGAAAGDCADTPGLFKVEGVNRSKSTFFMHKRRTCFVTARCFRKSNLSLNLSLSLY